MRESIEFKDFNFKLAVINKLMYERDILKPRFNVNEFIKNYAIRQIDIDEEGYEIISEVENYFKFLSVSSDSLVDIEEIYQDGGNEIYMQIYPFWDGEDDRFDIRSADDAVWLPKLKSAVLFYNADTGILEQFEKKGIIARWL